jgi:dihydrofolate synthase/folylpolyglutamate synthase
MLSGGTVDTYKAIIEDLYSKPRGNIKPGLERTVELCDYLDSPQDKYDSVHIAGTNGKGATVSIIASTLQEAGYKVGLYTSPHILRFNERIRINGKEISDNEIIEIYKQLKDKSEETGATFFEITTVLAFEYFASQNIDIAILETGMGGRWDCTNVVKPIASGITYIGFDHQEYLGDTIEKIASEKAGIIKKGIPVFTYADGKAEKVIEKKADSVNTDYINTKGICDILLMQNEDGYEYQIKINGILFNLAELNMPIKSGEDNIGLAYAVLQSIREKHPWEENHFISGIDKISENTGYIGRMQATVYRGKKIYLDIAHNVDAIENLIQEFKLRYKDEKPVYIFGIMADKDIPTVLKSLSVSASHIIFYCPNTPRAATTDKLIEYYNRIGIKDTAPYQTASSQHEALKYAIEYDKPIIITGSFHMVEDFLPILAHK